MKKFGKIFLVMAVIVVAMFAMMAVASAATIDSVSASVATDEGRTISVTVAYGSAEAAQQSTVLVVKQGTDIATLADTDIKYIDQEAVSENTITYTFKLLSDDRAGVYDVYVGGTAVDAPGKTAFSFDTRKIIGTVTVLGDATKATAVAKAGDAEVAGAVASDGKYTIEVGQGTYTVVLGKAGYLYRTIEGVAVADQDVTLDTVKLLGGDFAIDGVADGEITLSDLQAVLDAYGAQSLTLDLNDDGNITLEDLQEVLDNFGASAN